VPRLVPSSLGVIACLLVACAPASAASSRTVLQYGDSLAVGTGLYLDDYLRGWRVRSSTEISRHASDTPAVLRSFGHALPRVVVVSVGTNDDPGAISHFARTVRETVALAGPSRCVVWSTIVRPPYRGVSYAGYNRALRSVAKHSRTLHVFGWDRMARAHPGWFGSDGVHPSMQGYRARARAIAQLIKGC